MPAPYPQEFREDVVRVARSREDGVTLAQIAKDFGVHEMTLHKWIRQADIDDGSRPGKTREDSTELRDRSEEHTSELQSRGHLVCRLLLEKKKKTKNQYKLR